MLERRHVEAQLIGPAVQIRVLTEAIGADQADALADDVIDVMTALGPRAVIDFAAVRSIASAGFGALVRIHNNAKDNHGAVAFYNCTPNLAEGLKITRLNRLFKVAKNEAAAVKAVT
ncbi:MAG: STAS domain-containing protein [Planctomycetota bacterium]